MEIIQAGKDKLTIVQQIVYNTVRAIYPNYYPLEVVDFFITHHKDENISKDIEKGNVYLLMNNHDYVGTGTIEGQHINRVFILPQYQGKGYGTFLMDTLEKYISPFTDEIFVDASLSGVKMYLKRGYEVVEYVEETVNHNRVLFYSLMKKLIARKK